MVFGTVGTGGCSEIDIEVVSGREPGCWVDKGLGEGAGKEQGWMLMLGKLGADIQDVAEWAEDFCSVDFASELLER